MADRIWTRAHVWLAVASVLVVLVASGVAVSRIADNGARRRVSVGGPEASPLPDRPASGPSGPAAAGEAGTAPATGTAAGSPVAGGTAGLSDSAAAPMTAHGPTAAGVAPRTAAARPAGAAATAPASPAPSAAGSPSGAAPPAGSPAGGDSHPQPAPAPDRTPPQDMHLVGASVSAGQGAAGGVVGVQIGGATPAADVTVGTNPVVGHHPPANGTGIAFSGRFFHPPPSVPVLPG
ncbi:MAG TPA: hypothetical protein VGO87_12915 [Acidimicrobiia bacterium]